MNRKLAVLKEWNRAEKRVMETILKILLEEFPDAIVRPYKNWMVPSVELYYRSGRISAHFSVYKRCRNLQISYGNSAYIRKSTGSGCGFKNLVDDDMEGTHLRSRLVAEYVAWELGNHLGRCLQSHKEHPLRRPNGWYMRRSMPSSPALSPTPV